MSYKTMKQMADELHVSKQQVYRFIKKHEIEAAYQENGTLFFDDASEFLVKQGFEAEIKAFDDEKTEETHQKQNENTSNSLLETMLETLKNELEAKNKQIESLQNLLDQEQKLHLKTKNQLQQFLPAPKEEPVSDTVTATAVVNEENEKITTEEPAEPAPKKKRKGLFGIRKKKEKKK